MRGDGEVWGVSGGGREGDKGSIEGGGAAVNNIQNLEEGKKRKRCTYNTCNNGDIYNCLLSGSVFFLPLRQDKKSKKKL